MSTLPEYLEDRLPKPQVIETEENPDGEFIVNNKAKADWALRKIARAEARLVEDETVAALEIERVAQWIDERRRATENETRWARDALERYHREALAMDERLKTISLPSGKLKAYKRPDQWDVDAETFCPWAQDNARELVRVKVEPDKAAIKNLLVAREDLSTAIESGATDPATGEIVPGVTITPGTVRFSVEVTS